MLHWSVGKCLAFPCISTGLFGFPHETAAQIALSTTKLWLTRHPNQVLTIAFNVFSEQDLILYTKGLQDIFGSQIATTILLRWQRHTYETPTAS
jgi:O-acetyl-ADP-ribose deacetylase (regulator of RNase III)